MSISASEILKLDLSSEPIKGTDLLSKQELSLSILADGLCAHRPKSPILKIPVDDIIGFHLEEGRAYLLFKDRDTICFSAEQADLEFLRGRLNLLLIRHSLQSLSQEQVVSRAVELCPSCQLLSISERPDAQWHYCPHCQAIFNDKGEDLSFDKGYHVNFTSEGWFALIGDGSYVQAREGIQGPDLCFQSFRSEARPFIERIWGHLSWILLSFLLIGLLWQLGFYVSESTQVWLRYATYPLMAVSMASVLMLGYYWSGLMLGSSFMPLFVPPKIERFSRLCEKGRLLKAKRRLMDWRYVRHPGAQVNMALAYLQKGFLKEGHYHLSAAIDTCPSHPLLWQLAERYGLNREKEDGNVSKREQTQESLESNHHRADAKRVGSGKAQ